MVTFSLIEFVSSLIQSGVDQSSPVRGPLPDILLFVLLGDQHVGAVGLEVMGGDLPQDLHVHREVHLQAAVLDVVVPVGDVKEEGGRGAGELQPANDGASLFRQARNSEWRQFEGCSYLIQMSEL